MVGSSREQILNIILKVVSAMHFVSFPTGTGADHVMISNLGTVTRKDPTM